MAVAEKGMIYKHQADMLIDRWLNYPEFAEQLRSNPKAALESCGIKPETAIIEALSGIDSSTPAEELQRRISKGRT